MSINDIQMRRLTEAGIEVFSDWLRHGGPGSRPEAWLTDETLTEPIETGSAIDPMKVFADRFDLGIYVWAQMKPNWLPVFESDAGLWSWICLVYFEQFRPKDALRRIDNYIYNPHRFSYYRHCVAMPTKLARDFEDDARIFLSSDMTVMGDMLEQCMSRQYLMRSTTFRSAVRKLYFDEARNRLKTGAASKVERKKTAKGVWSRAGAGSVRRLATEILRLDLAFNLEAMSPDQLLTLLGREYDRFKHADAN